MTTQGRASSAIGELTAAQRNRAPIFDALQPLLAGRLRILEVGSGDATHARYAQTRLPQALWQTSERPAQYPALRAASADISGLPVPVELDVRGRWPAGRFDAVYAANVAHIMDWTAVCALFAGAARVLVDDGLLCLYGPFIEDGVALAPGNRDFDAALRARDPSMGLREIRALDSQARGCGMRRIADMAMPANNRLLIWRHQGSPDRVAPFSG